MVTQNGLNSITYLHFLRLKLKCLLRFKINLGQSKNGVLASHADMSQLGKGGPSGGGGVISYRVEFGEQGTELVPHTNILLKADQVLNLIVAGGCHQAKTHLPARVVFDSHRASKGAVSDSFETTVVSFQYCGLGMILKPQWFQNK